MSKQNAKPTAPSHGEGTGMNRDLPERGWGPSVDATHTEDNPSAHRAFHAEEFAPKPGPHPVVSKEEAGNPAGNPVESHGRRGEDQASNGSQNCWSSQPGPIGIRRGKGWASVPHSMAVSCWTISASANVEST